MLSQLKSFLGFLWSPLPFAWVLATLGSSWLFLSYYRPSAWLMPALGSLLAWVVFFIIIISVRIAWEFINPLKFKKR